MKKEFVFNKQTGTYQIAEENVQEAPISPTPSAPPLNVNDQDNVPMKLPSLQQDQEIVQMRRVDNPTIVQLLNEKGLPESYLEVVNRGVLMFREGQDYTLYQIMDERTSKPLMYIGGYALTINFNMKELRSVERVEQCLQGLTKLFRKFIVDQALDRD